VTVTTVNDEDVCYTLLELKRYKTHRTRLSSEVKCIPRGVIKSRGIFHWIVSLVDLIITIHHISTMSRASKIFLGGSIVVSGAVIYGVHWIQKYESDVRPLLFPYSQPPSD